MRLMMLLILAISALPAEAQVKFDPKTGLWFPPYATREDYLKRDPAHSYLRDVQRAFDESSQVAEDVCEKFLTTDAPDTADATARQYRMMVRKVCAIRMQKEALAAQKAPPDPHVLAVLGAMFDEEEKAIAAVPPEDRPAEASRLLDEVRYAEDDAANTLLRAGLRGIALWPRQTLLANELLMMARPQDKGTTFDEDDVGAFVEQLYRSRAANDGSNGAEWRSALPAVLLMRGRTADAGKAATAWLAEAPPDRISFARSMAAVIDSALGGKPDFAKVLATCKAKAEWVVARDGEEREYCLQAMSWLTVNTFKILGSAAPRALAETAFLLAALQTADAPIRLTLLKKAAIVDAEGAEKRFYEILASNASKETQVDAIHELAKLAIDRHPERVAALMDCWFRMHGVSFPPFSEDDWTQLAAMPEREGELSKDCFGPDVDAVASDCIVSAMQLRMRAAIRAKQWDIARQSVERLVAATVSRTDSPPAAARTAVFELGVHISFDEEHMDEAGPILGYVDANPHDATIERWLVEGWRPIARASSAPWRGHTRDGTSAATQLCPPKAPPR
jgi:hypothetical protein